MKCKTCPSCGGDTSTVPVKKRLSAQFLVEVFRCRHCKARTTLLTTRKFVKIVARAKRKSDRRDGSQIPTFSSSTRPMRSKI
jgi:hypothetical protein